MGVLAFINSIILSSDWVVVLLILNSSAVIKTTAYVDMLV